MRDGDVFGLWIRTQLSHPSGLRRVSGNPQISPGSLTLGIKLANWRFLEKEMLRTVL